MFDLLGGLFRPFRIGARRDDRELCQAAILSSPHVFWSESDRVEVKWGAAIGVWVIDPQGWPAFEVVETPHIYAWALSRAAKHYPAPDSQAPDRALLEKIADEFEDLLAKGRQGMSFYTTTADLTHSIWQRKHTAASEDGILYSVGFLVESCFTFWYHNISTV